MRSFHYIVPRFLDGSYSRDYLEACLSSLGESEGTVRAFVCLDTEAARRAAEESGWRYRLGRPLSLLDGLPLGVKDVIDTEDFSTEHGSALLVGNRPQWDAACVYWLRKGGAYVLGKTVTTEFATQPPGPTRNPWDLNRTPGGSSSGYAAAVAAAMVPVALGNKCAVPSSDPPPTAARTP